LSDEATLTDAMFARLATVLFQKTGIALKDYKKYLVVSRLAQQVGDGKPFPDFDEFFRALTTETDGKLMQGFINALTTNYSYFFRDPVHFDILAQYLRERAPEQSYLRLWSAASSTGEEAYTMAMTVARSTALLPTDRRILATDISTKVLGIAEKAVYAAETASRNLDERTRNGFFETLEDGKKLRVREPLRKMVDFRQLNLQGPFPFQKKMDVIFLRNVMIYFGQQEKAQLIEKMHDHLKPGGLLLIGLSESLAGIPHRFRSFKNSTFQKVRS